ncbi:helix-turn-helix domain-containing protein [Haloechinothrix halophila]|uniref:helix-turn-helix domain-containing protein n=1 Tax=Haloechinothrix halophila TaxID=1069073 RepID=UPI00146FA0F5|nr:helix-turn-helix domain-containing protein [Haloechinothrix halophila]
MGTTMSVRWAAIEDLQRRITRCKPGSDEEKTTEHAISLCLSETRDDAEPQHLVRNALRNGAHVLARGRVRERNALRRYASTHLRVVGTSDGQDAIDLKLSGEPSSIDGNDFCTLAIQRASTLGPFGPRFVQRLLAGDTVAEASKAVNISRASGYRAIRRLRALLCDVRNLADAG